MGVWSSNSRWRRLVPVPVTKAVVLMVIFIAIGKRIHMWVVKKGFVAITPRETL